MKQPNAWSSLGNAVLDTLRHTGAWLGASVRGDAACQQHHQEALGGAWRNLGDTSRSCAEEIDTQARRVAKDVEEGLRPHLRRLAGIQEDDIVVPKDEWERTQSELDALRQARKAASPRRAATKKAAPARSASPAKASTPRPARKTAASGSSTPRNSPRKSTGPIKGQGKGTT